MLGRGLLVPALVVGIVVGIVPPGISASAQAGEATWTLQRVIATADARAPAVVIAAAEAREGRAAMVDARRFATRNPVLEAEVGPRWADGRSTDVVARLSLPLDLGDRRDRRIAVAAAGITHDQLRAETTRRAAVGAAIGAYYAALHAERRAALADERAELATSAATTAAQRHAAGDVSELEVNLARGEVARAAAAVIGARGDVIRSRGRLALALGVPAQALGAIAGELADRSWLDTAARATAAVRPALRALAQESRVARAEAALARSERWPSLDVRIGVEHERDADVVLGGFAIALPIFERGQGAVARAEARATRADAELAARTQLAALEADDARTTYASTVEAARVLADDAVPLALANQTAATASYRAGKIDYATLLVIRREALDTRREHLDRLLEAAIAGIERWLAHG